MKCTNCNSHTEKVTEMNIINDHVSSLKKMHTVIEMMKRMENWTLLGKR